MNLSALALLVFSSAPFGLDVAVYDEHAFPQSIDAYGYYVFYSHGFIVEGDNPTPVHDRWGVYDFPAIKTALSDPSYQLIAAHRPVNTNPFEYAKVLAGQVTTLIEGGVRPEAISLVGFSRGGFITALASDYLKNTKVNFVILAACTSQLARNEEVSLYGHVFSMFETSDRVGSCDAVVRRSGEMVATYKELSISTGKEHGAFYTPMPDWLVPVKAWLKRER